MSNQYTSEYFEELAKQFNMQAVIRYSKGKAFAIITYDDIPKSNLFAFWTKTEAFFEEIKAIYPNSVWFGSTTIDGSTQRQVKVFLYDIVKILKNN